MLKTAKTRLYLGKTKLLISLAFFLVLIPVLGFALHNQLKHREAQALKPTNIIADSISPDSGYETGGGMTFIQGEGFQMEVDFKQVSVGKHFTCGIATDDMIYCWGYNAVGQLGTGAYDTANKERPTKIVVPEGVTGFSQISSGSTHSCAIDFNQQAYCWGPNDYGQIGDGSSMGGYAKLVSKVTLP